MIAAITQVLLAFALFFGVLTIAPKAVYYLRRKEIKRGLIYMIMLVMCAFFMALAGAQAFSFFKGYFY
jgi:hypothetical protein